MAGTFNNDKLRILYSGFAVQTKCEFFIVVCGVGWCKDCFSFFLYCMKLIFDCSTIILAAKSLFQNEEENGLPSLKTFASLSNRMFPKLYGHCINNTVHRGLLLLHRWCKAAASKICSWNSLMMLPHQRETWRGNNIRYCTLSIANVFYTVKSIIMTFEYCFILIDMQIQTNNMKTPNYYPGPKLQKRVT